MAFPIYFGIAILLVLVVLAGVYHDWVWRNTDNLTKWLQIAGLIVAGYWAYTRFSVVEAPSLETHVEVEDELYAERNPPPKTCFVTYRVTVTNGGSAAFDIREARIRAWPFYLEAGPGLTYVDLDKAQFSKPIIEKSFTSGYLEGHYPPKTTRKETFSWVLHAPTSRSYLFAVELHGTHQEILGSAKHVTLDSCKATTNP